MKLQYPSVAFALIGAMHEEVEALAVLLTGRLAHYKGHTRYYTGRLKGKRVVVFQSGIGKVNAALATAFVLEHFKPQAIINIGTAGSFDARLAIGDIVVSSEVRYHDVDVTLVGCAYGQVPGLPAAFPADERLSALTSKIAGVSGYRVLRGLICIGDFFMSDPAAIAKVRSRFPTILAADMEAAAVGHTCYIYGCPFVVIRAISDLVDGSENRQDFFTFLQRAAHNSAQIVAAVAGLGALPSRML